MTVFWFLIAVVVVPCIFGFPVAAHPNLKSLSLPARLSLTWAVGSFALTVVLTLCSAVRLPWTPWLVVLLGAPAVVMTVKTWRWVPPSWREQPRPRPPGCRAFGGGTIPPPHHRSYFFQGGFG